MNRILLIALVLLTQLHAFETVETEQRLKELFKSNTELKKQYFMVSEFLELYKNTLTKVEKNLLLQKELVWEKEVEVCLEHNSTECLTKHYLKTRTILKNKYIKEHHLITLGNIFEKLWKHYNETMVYQTSKISYNDKHQENSICLGEENQQITKGTVYLTRFYNKVFTLFQGKSFSDKKYCESDYTDVYKHQSLIQYILKNFSKKILKKQIILSLKILKNKDKIAIHKSLKKLDEMYLYFLNHTNVTKESIFRLNEKKNVCNYVMSNGEANHGHVVVIRSLGKFQTNLQLHSVVDYMYTFWNRRNIEGNIEKSHELLEFTLNILDKLDESK